MGINAMTEKMNSAELHIPSSNELIAGDRLPPLKKRPISMKCGEESSFVTCQGTPKTPETNVTQRGESSIRDILQNECSKKSVQKLLHASKSLTELRNNESGMSKCGKRLIRDIIQTECSGKSAQLVLRASQSLADLKNITVHADPTVNSFPSFQSFYTVKQNMHSSYQVPTMLPPQLKKPYCASLPGADTIMTLAEWNEQVELMIARHMQRRRNSMELWKQHCPVEASDQPVDV